MNTSKTIRFAVFSLVLGIAVQGAVTGAQASRYCDREARDVADSRHRPGEAAVVSGLGSAAVGAIIGGIIGGGNGAGKGAAIGGVSGAMGGVIGTSAKWRKTYNRAYARCMDEHRQPARYQQPAPVYHAPPQGSQEWLEYCASKYRSFDPQTGMYLAHSGRYRPCR